MQPFCLSLLPVHFFFSLFWYTDSASTFFLMWTWLSIEQHRYRTPPQSPKGGCKNLLSVSMVWTCFLAVASIAMRQTNAVWVAFFAARAVLLECLPRPVQNLATPSEKEESRTQAPAIPVRTWCKALLCNALDRRLKIVRILGPVVLPLIAFAVFVIQNGGVVVGDREHHQPVLHWMQPLYCALYCTVCLFPIIWNDVTLWRDLKQLRGWKLILVMGMALLAVVAVQHGTVVHPFLLADNRHYTFYIWRKVINRRWWTRYALIPGYLYSIYLIWKTLRSGKRHPLEIVLFLGATCVVLIPAHLVEFRYFTVPCIIIALLSKQPRQSQLAVMAMLFVLVNAFVLFMFLKRPFVWSDGSIARFMW